jgi:Skp family chaperone for outer membrane proteins
LLGHESSRTAELYAQVTTTGLDRIVNPLDNIFTKNALLGKGDIYIWHSALYPLVGGNCLMKLRQIFYILGLLLTGHFLYGQNIQGYIDYEKVVVKLPQYEKEQKILETRKKQLSDSIMSMAKDFQRVLEQAPHNVKMDSASKASLEARLTDLEKTIREAQQHAQLELLKTQSKIDEKLRDMVTWQLKEYCSNKNIVCIADNKSILYCKDCVDFTDDFVKYLKKRVD